MTPKRGIAARTRILAAGVGALVLVAAPLLAQDNRSTDAEITFNTGLVHLREGRIDMAVDSFKKAVKQDPKNAYFHKGLGIAYSRLADKCAAGDDKCRAERFGEAVDEARKALELNPYYVDARNDLGSALIALGRRDEGKKELLAAYEDPTNPTPELSARNLGVAFLEEKNLPQAESWLLTCVTRNKAYAEAFVLLGDVLLAQNKVTEAVAHLEQGEKSTREDPLVMLALGQAYYRAGRLSDARGRWEALAAKDPGGAAGRRALELLSGVQR